MRLIFEPSLGPSTYVSVLFIVDQLNFIKTSIIILLAFGINWLIISGNTHFHLSTSDSSVRNDISVNGYWPEAYRVKIVFESEGYTHTYVQNHGEYLITVRVKEPFTYLAMEDLSQLSCDLSCRVTSEDGRIYGHISIEHTTTVLGKRSEADLRESFREELIEKILNQIR